MKQNKLVPEGIEGVLLIKVQQLILSSKMIGGIRSGMGYCGAANP